MEKKEGIVLRANHFDPLWRRCWDRSFYDSGRCFVSYRDIERDFYDDAIKSTADGAGTFISESVWTIRHYLETRPEAMAILKQLASEGRFELLGSGENIIDTNMVSGEMIIRNLMLGTLWGRDVIGRAPSVGWYLDGFGSSAQLPQILRGCEYRWLAAISYNLPDAPYWQGLDGSIVYVGMDDKISYIYPCVNIPFKKHAPCKECSGHGCQVCNFRGYDSPRADFNNAPKDDDEYSGAVIAANLSGEEILPSIEIEAQIEEYNKMSKRFHFRQGIYSDLAVYIEKEISNVDNPAPKLISSKTENNPCQTGCYVSRIKTKQTYRENENALYTAELWDTVINQGKNHDILKDIWKRLSFTAFHDAITASHIDQAYDELMDVAEEIKADINSVVLDIKDNMRLAPDNSNKITVFNPYSFSCDFVVDIAAPLKNAKVFRDSREEINYPSLDNRVTFLAKDVPALGTAVYDISESIEIAPVVVNKRIGEINFGGFILDVTDAGISKVYSVDYGTVTNCSKFFFGELVLETDIGDPWCTRSNDRTRYNLSRYTHLESITESANELVIQYKGKHPLGLGHIESVAAMVYDLSWEQSFIIRKGIKRIDVKTDVKWYTQNSRLRIMFPSRTAANQGFYEIPAGILERERYEQIGFDAVSGAGDWPALNWVGIDMDNYIFTVLNSGTPSARIEDGAISYSILRSPSLPAWLYEPFFYTAFNYNYIADQGEHSFKHSFVVAKDKMDAQRFGVAFNNIPFAVNGNREELSFLELDAKGTILTSVKKSETDNSIIIRLTEYLGIGEHLSLNINRPISGAFLCNMLESDLEELNTNDGVINIAIAPNKILTIKLIM